MLTKSIMFERLNSYVNALIIEELSKNTVAKYKRDIEFFLKYFDGEQLIDKKSIMRFKDNLLKKYKKSTVNSYLISINRYFLWLGVSELAVKTVALQRQTNLDNIISYEEYVNLLNYCIRNGKHRDYLLLRTIAGTGIRVGELKYITYEAVIDGSVEIYSKSKSRIILIPNELSRKLVLYCSGKNINKGIIFRGRTGNALSPKSIWSLLKRTAKNAGINSDRVYPHALRHLFAKTYMQKIGNVFELADLLGHSNIETTRIYTLSSSDEKRDSLNRLGL